MKTNETIRTLCKNGFDFTEKMFFDEVKQRIASNDTLCKIFEYAMGCAKTENEQTSVMYMIFDFDKNLKELFEIYLYYRMRKMERKD